MIINFYKENYINLAVHCSKHYIPRLKVIDFLKMTGYIDRENNIIESENLKNIHQFKEGSFFNIYVSNEFAKIITCTFIDTYHKRKKINAVILELPKLNTKKVKLIQKHRINI